MTVLDYRIPFADPLPLSTREGDWRRLMELRHMLATGQGIAKRAARSAQVKDIRPTYWDNRHARVVDPHGRPMDDRDRRVPENLHTETGFVDFFPDRFAEVPRIQIEIYDTCRLGEPRSSIGINSLDDVLSGQYKPVKYTAMEYSPHHYGKVAAQYASLRGYVRGHRFPEPNRFHTFDPTPHFEETYGFIRFIGR